MNPSPLISVVVPVFRIPEPFLRDCALSLRRQSLGSAEFLFVLDGPDPEARELLESLFDGDPRFSLSVLPENRGVSAARNAALEKARGRFVAFLDADDFLPPDALVSLCGAAGRDADFVAAPAAGAAILGLRNRLAVFPPPPAPSADESIARLHVWANASACGSLFASTPPLRFEPGLRSLEDARFLWSRLSASPAPPRIRFASAPAYVVVPRPDSASRSPLPPADLAAHFDSLAFLAALPLPPGAGPRSRSVRAVQLLLWAFVDALRAAPDAWSAALPRARAFIAAFRKSYRIPLLLRPLVRRRLSSPERLASPSRAGNALLWNVFRWSTRRERAEPLLLSLLALFCPPAYRALAPRFAPLPSPCEAPR